VQDPPRSSGPAALPGSFIRTTATRAYRIFSKKLKPSPHEILAARIGLSDEVRGGAAVECSSGSTVTWRLTRTSSPSAPRTTVSPVVRPVIRPVSASTSTIAASSALHDGAISRTPSGQVVTVAVGVKLSPTEIVASRGSTSKRMPWWQTSGSRSPQPPPTRRRRATKGATLRACIRIGRDECRR